MTITIEQVIERLEAGGLKVGRARDGGEHCGVMMQTRSYVDADGDHCLQLVCRLDQGGAYLEVAAPRAYSARNARHRPALFEALLGICYGVKHVRAEHDPTDGEVRFAIDMPVLDNEVTTQQLCAMVAVLFMTVEEFHAVIVHAMDSGEIDMERRLSVLQPGGPGRGDGGGGDDSAGDGRAGDDMDSDSDSGDGLGGYGGKND